MRAGSKSLFFLLLLLGRALPSLSQTEVVEIRATGEHRTSAAETPELAKRFALLAAGRNVLRQAAGHLRNTDDLKAIPLNSNPLDAFLPVLLVVETASAPDDVPGGTALRAEAVVRFRVADVALRLNKLRKDPNAVTALVRMWKQAEEIHQQLAEAGNSRSQKEKEVLIGRLQVKRLVAHVHAALAKTEESPASRRVASLKGRQRAKQLAEVAVSMGPDLPETHLAMGDVAVDSDLLDIAETEYRKAVSLDSASSGAHVRLAEALRLQGKLPEAVVELREALRLDPKSAVAHADLGVVLGSQQKSSEAIAEYQEALRLDPDFIEAHNFLAIALAREGRTPDAVAQFREIVRIDPDSVLGYYNLGIALADMDEDGLSAEAFRNAVRVNPNHFNSRFNIGELFRLEGKHDDAVKQFREYLRLAPDTPQNQRNIQRAKEFVQTHENP
jgi:tetratricopeptide (TPR) repeat protein